MKREQVNKLYSKLTPSEQAVLVWQASMRGDTAEAEEVEAFVPKQNFLGYHCDYRRRLSGLNDLSMYYGMVYWQAHSHYIVSLVNADTKEVAYQCFENWVAVQVALIEVCKRLKLDSELIKRLAQCDSGIALNELMAVVNPKPELIEKYIELFMLMAG